MCLSCAYSRFAPREMQAAQSNVIKRVRASMVDHPASYPWSSYRCNSAGHANPIITNHEQYTALGKSPEERQQAYRALFEAHITEKQLDEIRRAANSEWVLGSDRFKTRIEQNLQRQVAPLPRGGDRKSKSFRSRHQINRH